MSQEETEQFVDYYKLFDIEPAATLATIRTRYIRLAKDNHPDVGGSTAAMQRLNTAYKTLANSTSRAAYDMLHGLHTGRDGQPVYQYTQAPSSASGAVSDDYVDMFIEQLYNELSSIKKQSQKQSLFQRLFGSG